MINNVSTNKICSSVDSRSYSVKKRLIGSNNTNFINWAFTLHTTHDTNNEISNAKNISLAKYSNSL